MTLRFALNISLTLPDRPIIERLPVASQAGFEAVELYWPDDATLAGATLAQVAQQIHAEGLGVALVNVDGDAVEPSLDRFDERLARAIRFALEVGCPRLNLPAGEGNVADPETRTLLAQRVARAADACRALGLEVMLEAINPTTRPAWLVPDVDDVLRTIDAVDRPNVRLQLDVFHVHMVGRDVFATIDAVAGRTGHVQLADLPDRHEPGTGTLNLGAVIGRLVERGYRGDLGLEYVSTRTGPGAFDYLPGLVAARDAALAR